MLAVISTAYMLAVITVTVTMFGVTAAVVVECHQSEYEAKLRTEPDLVFSSRRSTNFFCKGSDST